MRKQDHGATKGIEPLTAAQGHAANLPLTIREALRKGHEQGILRDVDKPTEIDAIAVTQGPGMTSCLVAGLCNAKLLSTLWDRPLIYVHHMVAHALTALMTSGLAEIRLPFLVLLLSGGHTQLVLCRSVTQFHILATTTDDSIGDAFDKAARALQIDFDWAQTAPGAALERFARPDGAERFPLPVAVQHMLRFSYSGLKAALIRLVSSRPEVLQDEPARRAIAYSFQMAAFAQIQDKLQIVLQPKLGRPSLELPADMDATQFGDLVVSGGVASNSLLRETLRSTLSQLKRPDMRLHFPPIALCTDNAAMIAHAGLVNWQPTNDLTANPRARWSLADYP